MMKNLMIQWLVSDFVPEKQFYDSYFKNLYEVKWVILNFIPQKSEKSEFRAAENFREIERKTNFEIIPWNTYPGYP